MIRGFSPKQVTAGIQNTIKNITPPITILKFFIGEELQMDEMNLLKDKYELLISWWRSLNITDDAGLAEAFNGHIINFAYNSGNIENPNVTYHDTREIFEHDSVTGRNETGASAEDVPDEMRELLEDLKTLPEEPEKVLTAAAFFHAKFENIHPFADGNGRTGRLVMNYLLAINNHPPLVIHHEDRKAYFEALEAWDTEQNLKPLKTFLLEQIIKTWAKRITVLEKAEDEEDLKDFKQAMDEFKKNPKTYTHEEMKKMFDLE